VWLPERADLVAFLVGELRPGDVCISMGCGDVAELPDEVLAGLVRKVRS
jgi:UDP-N-acetylmuramate--alanine ligase